MLSTEEKARVKIDGNEAAKEIMPLYHQKRYEESSALEEAVLRQIRESGQDHCSCRMDCSRHGNCVDCILLHRAHRDHLPCCLWDMVKERVPDPCGLCDHKPRR